MKSESTTQLALATMVRLKPAAVFECQLDVHAKRILGTVPYSWSFAMRDLPPGPKLRVPPASGAPSSRRPAVRSMRDPDELEALLQQMIPGDPRRGNRQGQGRIAPAPRRRGAQNSEPAARSDREVVNLADRSPAL